MKIERRNTEGSGGKEQGAGGCATECAQQSQRRTADSKSAAVKDSLRHRPLHCAGVGVGGTRVRQDRSCSPGNIGPGRLAMGSAPQTFPVAPPRPGPELTFPRPKRAAALAT